MKMSSQGILQQGEGEQWAESGWGSHGSHVLKPTEGSTFMQDVDGVAFLSGGARGQCGEQVPSLTFSTGIWNDFGSNSTLFSPSDLFSPSSRQLLRQSSSLYWQNLLGSQANSRWLTRSPSPGFETFGAETGTEQAGSFDTFSLLGGKVKRSNDVQLDVAVTDETHATSGALSGIEVALSTELEIERNKNVNFERKNWRTVKDTMHGSVKREEVWNTTETTHSLEGDLKSQNRLKRTRPQGNPEVIENFEASATSSEFNSDSEEPIKRKEQFSSRKGRRPGQDADGNVTWTDDSVTFLFKTYDTIHQRLCKESKGPVKYQKKWIPILRAMRARFGKHFTKKQCQSKYWSVRRECTEYRTMSAKAAATDPCWNPSIAGRELLKPKFYDVWLAVSGQYQDLVAKPKNSSARGEKGSREVRRSGLSHVNTKIDYSMKQDSGAAMKEMYLLMLDQLQASEKREEAIKYRAERMMECLLEHMEHVETRVGILDAGRGSQQLLERVNFKLEKILDGFITLNQNLSLLY